MKCSKKGKKKKDETKNIKQDDLITLLTIDNKSVTSSCNEFELYPYQKDPLKKTKKKKKSKKDDEDKPKILPDILPSMSVRLVMGRHCEPKVYPPLEYKLPLLKGTSERRKKIREKSEKGRKHFCHFEVVKVPSPLTTMEMGDDFTMKSPKLSEFKVMPQKTSVTKGAVYPTPQTQSLLEVHKPKSGIYVNVTGDKPQLPPEKELPIIRRPPKKRSILREPTLAALFEGEEYYEEEEFYMSMEGEEEIDISAEEYFKTLQRKVSQTSAATSFNSKDLMLEEEISWERIAVISKLVQTFREENEKDRMTKPKKRFRKGTLQSHSFTKLKQKILPDICFKLVSGTIHQGDSNYAEISRDKQGICMPIAAYCYAHVRSPKYWSEVTVDEIIDIGNRLFLDSIGSLHMHADEKELKPTDLHKYVYIGDKKMRFAIDEPDIVGYVRSVDKRVYNITKGLKLFLQRNIAGILQATNLNVMIWKSGKKYLYFFDATPRATDLCQERTGTAVLAKFCKFDALITVLLNRTDLGNSPFTISPVVVKKILCRNEKDEEVVVHERSNYNILNENKAVVQASFDLGDKCFEFTRNKQAVPMAIMALMYSRITPASSWKRSTVDKIMMLGNQLFVECSEAENKVDINLEDIPSAFSLGPYAIEIYIYANLYTDLMFKKSVCEFEKCLNAFFEKNTNAIVQIGKHTLAIWSQRNMYFMFDPYTRNNEALKCRLGTGCVSMLSNVETIVDIITSNFDNKELIFRMHALKILKINRDSELSRLFPKGLTMSAIPVEAIKKTKIRRCKKKAIEKPILIQPSEYAMKKISAGDSPGPSIYEIDSNVQSIQAGIIPPLPLKLPPKSALVEEAAEKELVANLDSPSLSDTQIEPERPRGGTHEIEIMMVDLDSYDSTMDELEMQGEEEEEDYEAGGDRRRVVYTMRSLYSQVRSMSLDSYHKTRSAVINTDLTYNYKILPSIELPIKQKQSEVQMPLYYIAPDDEIKKESNYTDCEDGGQIICGSENITKYTTEPDRVAPFICLFGIAMHEEIPISKWRSKTIDFILKSGKELYDQYEEPYNKIEDFDLQFPQNQYKIFLEMVMDTYVGNDIFKNSIGIKIIKDTLEATIFRKHNSAIVITPHYICGILKFNSLYYLLDFFGGIECGPPDSEDVLNGFAFVCRFKTMEEMIIKFLQTKNRRDGEASLEYVRFVLCIPIINLNSEGDDVRKSGTMPPKASLVSISTTQSQELAKPNNYMDLPDDSQILRGKSNIADYGEDVEFMAPFVSIMATCIAEKYSVITWTTNIVDYVLQCGSELFKQSSIRFDQVAKIVIPKITLGHTDYSIEVNYIHDAPMKHANLEKSLTKHLVKDYEWLLIVTRYYACAVCVKNHLYYLYDPFGSNELGYGLGLSNDGLASLQRFKNLHSMVLRILNNKNKREFEEVVEHTKFVLSSCTSIYIPPDVDESKKKVTDDTFVDGEEALYEKDEEEDKDGKEEKKKPEKSEKKKVNKVGYQTKKKFEVIEGTSKLANREMCVGELKDDHFICLVALLNVLTTSMPRWDTKRVDAVIDQGKRIYDLAEDLNETNKRFIKNILIGSHLFDIIVKKIKIEDWKKNKNLDVGMNTVLRKRRFCLIQFENCSYALYRDDDGVYHLFDPYGLKYKIDENAEEEELEEEEEKDENTKSDSTPKTCWIKFTKYNDLKKYIRDNIVEKLESYTFYTFVVMSVRPAPKDVILTHKLNIFDVGKKRKDEVIGKPFYEQDTWLKMYQLPWSLANNTTACGKHRHKRSSKWFNWDIEYVNDLFSLAGTIHQISKKFETDCRGKQTLNNIVMAIAMVNIYDLNKWNSSVIDSILNYGNEYFKQCTEDIKEENYELQISDLIDSATVPPFKFQVQIKNVVEGTMFLVNEKKFNLYKALRYFFEHYENRNGIVCAVKNNTKKFLAFGKTHANEYYVFDCQTYGSPMFSENQGVAYALRCLTLNRLLYCLVTTLRGGDFFIFEVETYNFRSSSD